MQQQHEIEPGILLQGLASEEKEEEEGGGRLEIVVDVRERALIAALRSRPELLLLDAENDDVTVRGLDVADVEIRDRGGRLLMLIERKTMGDLASSLADGRYHEQKHRIRSLADATGATPMYCIEGASSGFAFDGRFSASTCPPRIRGLVTSLLVRHRTLVAFTRDVADTAAFVLQATKTLRQRQQQQQQTSSSSSSYATVACRQAAAKKSANLDPAQCFLQQLCQVPGVSSGIAKNLAASYASMGDLVLALAALPDPKARRAALQRVPLVGPKISANVCAFVLGCADGQ